MIPADGPQPFTPRSVVLELCERLGHDPNRVSRIVIDPESITVEYGSRLVDASVKVVEEPRRPQVGDRAHHKGGELDSRTVVAVSEDGALVGLEGVGGPGVWFPAESYTFTPGVKA